VFTSNLISQTTWLKVKLKLVNFSVGLGLQAFDLKFKASASNLTYAQTFAQIATSDILHALPGQTVFGDLFNGTS